MGKQRTLPHVDLTPDVISQIATEFENGVCIPELMEKYGWCRNKITAVLRVTLGERYSTIAAWIAKVRRIEGSRRTNTGRTFKQNPEWISKRTSKIRGQKRTVEQRQNISKAGKLRLNTGRDIESYRLGAAKARETKLKTGAYDRTSARLASLHAAGQFYSERSHQYGIKSTYVSLKTGEVTRCDSNFERSRAQQLDVDPHVVSWTKKHHIVISYVTIDGLTRRFIPDFLIVFCNGAQVLEELKGRNYDAEINRLKFEALKAYCSEHGLRAQWTWQKTKDRF